MASPADRSAAPPWLAGVLATALAACDPAAAVAAAVARLAPRLDGRRVFALAIGKAAAAMARGAGPVARGLIVAPDDGPAPAGWARLVGGHPRVDRTSLLAGAAARALVAAADEGDVVLALISGGASALVEAPRSGISLDELAAVVGAVMAAGAPIAVINEIRGGLSALKRGGLARGCRAPIVTLATSDVPGDELAVIGSGPTIRSVAAVSRAAVARRLGDLGVAIPAGVAAWLGGMDEEHVDVGGSRADHAEVLLPRRAVAEAALVALAALGVAARPLPSPLDGDVGEVADLVASELARGGDLIVGHGEPTVRLPAGHGAGGRAQQLALALAARLRGGDGWALIAGTDGVDGVAPPGQRPVAGAIVDGASWDAITAAGLDPAAALARCDAYPALAAIGAHLAPGPTGINHADVIIAGRGLGAG